MSKGQKSVVVFGLLILGLLLYAFFEPAGWLKFAPVGVGVACFIAWRSFYRRMG